MIQCISAHLNPWKLSRELCNVKSLQGALWKHLSESLLLLPLKALQLWAWLQSILLPALQPNLMATSYSLGLNFLQVFPVKLDCGVLLQLLFNTTPETKNTGWFRGQYLLLCQHCHRLVHLPQFHRLPTRVNIYKCALNNICCGLGSAAWWSRGDEAHHELMGTYAVSGSIRSLGGFKCHKQLVPDAYHEVTQMN